MKFKKQAIGMLAAITIMTAFAPIAYAAVTPNVPTSPQAPNYEFNTTYETDQWGKPTTSEAIPDTSAIENVRRDKNAAYFAPKYGVFSGELPSSPTNPYITQTAGKSTISTVNAPTYGVDSTGGGTSVVATGSSNVTMPTIGTAISMTTTATGTQTGGTSGFYVNYTEPEVKTTTVTPYSDGSIGTVSIPRFKLSVKVFEGVDLPVLKAGVGHFTYTSQWDGNIGLASHNRGPGDYFRDVKSINIGDQIKYTTKLGTRTYEVFTKTKVNETDTSYLGYSEDNIITLTTCVENDSPSRWMVQAREVK